VVPTFEFIDDEAGSSHQQSVESAGVCQGEIVAEVVVGSRNGSGVVQLD